MMALLVASAEAATSGCRVHVNTATGDYRVLIGTEGWLVSAPTRFHAAGKWYSSHDKSLVLTGSTHEDGKDGVGQYNATTLKWRGGSVAYETIFRQYESSCIFEQRYPMGVSNMSTGKGVGKLLASAFPSFDLDTAAQAARGSTSRGFYLWQGGGVPANNGWRADGTGTGVWPPAHKVTESCKSVQNPVSCSLVGVTAIFDEALRRSAVLSAANNFLAAAQQFEPAGGGLGRRLTYGMHARNEKVPAGFRLQTIVHGSAGGPNVAMREWGAALLRRSGKPRGVWRQDRSLQMLGYTTDNGAYYCACAPRAARLAVLEPAPHAAAEKRACDSHSARLQHDQPHLLPHLPRVCRLRRDCARTQEACRRARCALPLDPVRLVVLQQGER